MHNFKKLSVWQKSIDLALNIYDLTDHFPKEEKFGLSLQMRRACVSIPSNLAEGAGRQTNGEFRHFIGIAQGSCFELETQLILAHRRSYIEKQQFTLITEQLSGIQKQNYKLSNTLKIK